MTTLIIGVINLDTLVTRLVTVTRLVNDLGINLAGVDVIMRLSAQIEKLQSEINKKEKENRRLRKQLQ